MGSQMSFGDLEPQGQRRKTRREGLPERMDAAVPWDRWRALVGPSCHSQARGRHARGRAMLRDLDAGSGLVYAAETTAANVSGASAAHAPAREGGASCCADSGHTGVAERPEVASGPHPSSVRWTTARKPSAIEGLDCALPAERGIESRKASVRSGAEHPSLIAKRRSGHLKTRC